MNHPVLVSSFLALGVLSALIGCAGMVAMRGAASRLHYVSFSGLVAPCFVLAAVLSAEGLSQAGRKAILLVLVVLVQSPAIAHVLGRAIYFYEHPRSEVRGPRSEVRGPRSEVRGPRKPHR